ncbi:MAG: diguanylate cyclase response regulator [Herbinix sp.]|jgi:diguanylate cyclase (GGDEF)-like protein|nr:diguanylate cyclase response regulator [Herbinix sp.]
MINKDKATILLVDDRPDNLFVLQSLLDNLDCRIVKATSGNEALSIMLDQEIALVLLDVQMPEMDGFEVAELMRGSEKTRYIPIIFVTAISKEQKCIFKGYEVGAVDYLFKPIEPVILQSKVRVFLELYNQKLLIQGQAELLEIKIKELMEMQEDNRRLESLSICDGLTGISNRRCFDDYMERSWKNSIRTGKPISLIMADIDCFKAYNDNYGHLQGDDCLVKVARAISSSIKRPIDFAARYGGEEFAIILPDTEIEGGLVVAENIRRCIDELSLAHEFSPVGDHITLSLGVATFRPKQSDQIGTFINKADIALYNSKQGGRNKITYFEEELNLAM